MYEARVSATFSFKFSFCETLSPSAVDFETFYASMFPQILTLT